MRIGKTKLQSKGAYTPCPECGEYYLQSIYIREGQKWVKIGMGCPECLKRELKEENKKSKGGIKMFKFTPAEIEEMIFERGKERK